MRIRDWSSDVCSSDLPWRPAKDEPLTPGRDNPLTLRGVAPACVASISVIQGQSRAKALSWEVRGDKTLSLNVPVAGAEAGDLVLQIQEHGVAEPLNALLPVAQPVRSKERRVGKESVSTCRSGGSPLDKKK